MKEKIISKILEIERALPESHETIGLYTGEAGKAMFYSYLSDYFGTNEYDEKIEKALVNIFETVNNGNYNTTFCSGLSGVIWSIEHLKQKNLLELEDTFESIYDALKESALYYSARGEFDFLHGADGIVYCLLMMDAADETFINKWLALLYESAIKEKNGFVWETILSTDSDKRIFNLSLSHGLSSKIIVLAEALKKYPSNILARELAEGSVNYLLNCKNDEHSNFCFPSYIDDENAGQHSRLAWCYGDLGNAIALWRIGCLMNNETWKNQAVAVMLLAATKKDPVQEGIKDAGFCHGSAGIAHIFNRFYMETGKKEFDEARWFWLKKTFEFGTDPDGIAGFKKHRGPDKAPIPESNFLEGVTGIAMVLLSFLSDKKESIAWDACFLMN